MPIGKHGNHRVPHPSKRIAQPKHSGIHNFLIRNYPKTGLCEHCGKSGKTHYAAKDHANYTRNREDYMELCPRCHVRYDDRMPPSQKGRRISAAHIEALQAGRRRQREAVRCA